MLIIGLRNKNNFIKLRINFIYDNRGKKYWQNMHTKHIQHVKPDSETYLIQASIAGNLAFIELYIKSQGDLVITDQ